MKRSPHSPPCIALAVAICLLSLKHASAELPALGDLNRDGETDVLDVQATISQILGVSGVTGESDLNENGDVDVADVQNMINTALDVGGLVQRIRGRIDCGCDAEAIQVVAISGNGRRVVAEANSETGLFRMALRARTHWALAVWVRLAGETEFRSLGTMQFPVAGEVSCTLPLPTLSPGGEIDLGVMVRVGDHFRPLLDVRRLLADLDPPLPMADRNENGVPDFVEGLLRRVRLTEGLPENFNIDGLMRRVGNCVANSPRPDEPPDLSDENANHVPDFIEPFLGCLRMALTAQLSGAPEGGLPNLSIDVELVVTQAMATVASGIREWLAGLDRPNLVDNNENGLPDALEGHLCTATRPAPIDANSNGVPDFAEDHDGDGTPNIDDPEWRARPDAFDVDGDGIPDGLDHDNDNDGVPNYAESDASATTDTRAAANL